ncbi:MAG: putative selenate reductase subunit YgfK [Candidatus Cloacimonadales bacterium]
MSDIMIPLPFPQMLKWISSELKASNSIFDIPREKFYFKETASTFSLFGEKCETPIGPAAGPNTQVAQNIVAAYLTGSRFFELKTVQIMDTLDVGKPCIDAEDEGYNTEWSTELTVPQAFDEYVKAWFLLHILNKSLGISNNAGTNFIFNMSVGYDLAGIKKPKIDNFIEGLKDATKTEIFQECQTALLENIDLFENVTKADIMAIPAKISKSVTLSTMHGCPPEEQESIASYLMQEKKVHTFVKLNPTLHGYDFVRQTFDAMGFSDIPLKKESFTHDLQYDDAVEMLHKLLKIADEENLTFGVKLSNTLPVVNQRELLPGDEMYMSGRTLYPLTINLAQKLSHEFDAKLKISYSGGANYFNIAEIYKCGIRPITLATDILKPGGYAKLQQMAEELDPILSDYILDKIDLKLLDKLADSALHDPENFRESKFSDDLFLKEKLPLTDCFIAPCKAACPVLQDVPEYIRLIEEKRWQEAYELIISKNPLATITGNICDHVCMYKCVRNDYECPLSIRELKRVAVENGQKISLQIPSQKHEAKIAIIGAGPAGLSAGFFLAKDGFDVTIMDQQKELGGMVKYGIPGFRISDEIIENDLDLIRQAGVKFQMGVDPDFDLQQLKSSGFQYVILAIGAWRSRMMQIAGAEEINRSAIKFLQEFKQDPTALKLGKNVAVIGAGNSAMDAARAISRTPGVEKTYIIYRRTKKQMPADKEELAYALADGVEFYELLNPIKYADGLLTCQVMQLGEKDDSGRRRPIPLEGMTKSFAIDNIFSAIGEQVDYQLLDKNDLELTANFETNQPNVFIAGDALRGPNSIIQAVADGKSIAEEIMQRQGVTKTEILAVEDLKFDLSKRAKDIAARKAVVANGYEELQTADEISQEASRCLQCNYVCNKCVEVCPNRANVKIVIDDPLFRDGNQILHLDPLCNECGNCETFCPYDSAPYKDKFNLYWNEEDFLANQNDGFMLIDQAARKFKIRLNQQTEEICFDADWQAANPFKINNFEKIAKLISTVVEDYAYLLKSN